MEKEYDCMEVIPENLKSTKRNTQEDEVKEDAESDS